MNREKEVEAKEQYVILQEEIEPYSFSKKDDVAIAKKLLHEYKMDDQAVIKAIAGKSPLAPNLSDMARKYGKEIIRSAKKNITSRGGGAAPRERTVPGYTPAFAHYDSSNR